MFGNTTVSSRSSSSRSGNSYERNSSMPSLRLHNPLPPKTSFNPLFRHSDQLTSFDASNFVLEDEKCKRLEKKRTYLRRYNSHESSYSFDIVKSSSSQENTPESTKSRVGGIEESLSSSADRRNDKEFSARDFLERYSLPRVVKVDDGEPLLLYRCFDSFTKIQTKAVFFKKGKEKIDENLMHFPEGYSGWFSLLDEKGEKHAVAHSSILHLVREQVCSFLAVQPFSAYATQSTDPADVDGELAYFKTQVQGGQLFQLRAVFQHQEQSDGSRKSSTRSSRISRSSRDKDLANRYAQLVSQTNQELYVPLTTKGEFYETHTSLKSRLCFPGMLDKTGPLALDKDCLYKISHLLRRVPLPVKVKLLHGSLPDGIPKDFTDTFVLEKKLREPLLVTCTLPPPWSDTPHKLSCYNLNSKIKISKFTFGFDSENRLFKSQRVQTALAFCHKNVETWYKDVKLVPNVREKFRGGEISMRSMTEGLCSDCKNTKQQCNETECNAKIENLANIENNQIITKEVMNKFSKPKKWYKHFKLLNTNSEGEFEELKDPMDGMEKRRSIDRYKDMSKLIEEKLGRKGYNPVKKSASFMFSAKRIDFESTQKKSNNPALLKCQSLDSQLCPLAEETHNRYGTSKSNKSDNLSYEFQMCILDSGTSSGERKGKQEINIVRKNDDVKRGSSTVTHLNLENTIFGGVESGKLKKTKPDLIPTLPKEDTVPNSFITERLCAEFHVKTKVQKKASNRIEVKLGNKYRVNDPKKTTSKNIQSEVSRVLLNVDEIPYSHVADEVCSSPSGKMENIYAEICETDAQMCNECDSKNCECRRTKSTQYCYVKLGSNGDSVTQSDSDDAIYNTLR